MITTPRLLRTGALLVASAVAVACAKKDTAASADTAAAASAPQASSSTPATTGQKEDFQNAIRNYQLSDDNVNRTIEVNKRFATLKKTDPAAAAAIDRSSDGGADAKSAEEMATRLDAMPGVHAILSSAGISAKDFVMTTFTLMETGAAYQMKKAGHLPATSELAKSVNQSNLDWVAAHPAQMKALESATGSDSSQ